MGECVSSICERQKEKYNEEDDTNNIIDNIANPKELGYIKKKQVSIPKNVIVEEEDDDDIVVSKHISDTSVIKNIANTYLSKSKEILENNDIKEKIKKARKNWEKLIDRLIQKRIDILREMVKKEKMEQESDEEEDEKIEDLLKLKKMKPKANY